MEGIKTMKPWERKPEKQSPKEQFEQVEKTVTETKRYLSLSVELKLLVYMLIFWVLVKIAESVKTLI